MSELVTSMIVGGGEQQRVEVRRSDDGEYLIVQDDVHPHDPEYVQPQRREDWELRDELVLLRRQPRTEFVEGAMAALAWAANRGQGPHIPIGPTDEMLAQLTKGSDA